jgi:hypothetical protein
LFQMFYLDVSKVDLGVAHVAMATHACLKHIVFHLFQTYIVNVSSESFKSRLWCCTYYNEHACFKCFICFHIYVVNVSSECFKSRSGVACRRPPAADGVPPEACRRLCGAHLQAGQVGAGHGSTMQARSTVPLCGHRMGVLAQDGRGPRFLDVGAGWE